MSFKAFIRALTPPFLWEAEHEIKIRIRPPAIPLTEIRFGSWAQACAAAGNYDDSRLTEFRRARSELNRKNDNLPHLSSQPLYWLTALSPGQVLRITDFGGSFGEYGEALCRVREGLVYTVVEHKTLVSKAPVIERLVFTDTIPEACEIFFTRNTLQYLDDPYAVAEAGLRSASQAVVLSRICFAGEDMFRVQQSNLFNNGGGAIPEGFEDVPVTYPLRTIREDRIAAIAREAGFRLVARTPEPETFSSPETYTMQLIYARPSFLRTEG